MNKILFFKLEKKIEFLPIEHKFEKGSTYPMKIKYLFFNKITPNGFCHGSARSIINIF